MAYVSITPFSNGSILESLCFHHLGAWNEDGNVSITWFSLVFISYVRTKCLLCFGPKSVAIVIAIFNDFVSAVYIEKDAFSNVSVFELPHFEQRFQVSPFLIVLNGNILETWP